MPTIGAGNYVIGAQQIDDADCNRFLTDGKMNRTLNLVRRIEVRNCLFDSPYFQY